MYALDGSSFRFDLGLGLRAGAMEEAEKGIRTPEERKGLRAIVRRYYVAILRIVRR